MKKTNVLPFAALFTALIFAATAYLVHIPVGNGYIHLGDAFVCLAACFLPAPFAAAAAAGGAALADVATGGALWAPATLLIKGLMTLPFTRRGRRLLCARNVAAALIALPVNVGGYFLAEWLLWGQLPAALASAPMTALQWLGGSALFVFLAAALDRAGVKGRLGL